jgi:hypothetical protein
MAKGVPPQQAATPTDTQLASELKALGEALLALQSRLNVSVNAVQEANAKIEAVRSRMGL